MFLRVIKGIISGLLVFIFLLQFSGVLLMFTRANLDVMPELIGMFVGTSLMLWLSIQLFVSVIRNKKFSQAFSRKVVK